MYDALIRGTDNPLISVDCRQITNKFCCNSLHDVWRLCQRYLTIPSKIICKILTGVSCDGFRPIHNHLSANACKKKNCLITFEQQKWIHLVTRLVLIPFCKLLL